MKPLKQWGRKLTMILFQYLGDWLNANLNRRSLVAQTLALVDKCIELDLLVNLEKSELVPKQVIVFLGDRFDFTKGLVFPTVERVAKIAQLCQMLLSLPPSPLSLWPSRCWDCW